MQSRWLSLAGDSQTRLPEDQCPQELPKSSCGLGGAGNVPGEARPEPRPGVGGSGNTGGGRLRWARAQRTSKCTWRSQLKFKMALPRYLGRRGGPAPPAAVPGAFPLWKTSPTKAQSSEAHADVGKEGRAR